MFKLKLNFHRSLKELLDRGFRFEQDKIIYAVDNVTYLVFEFKECSSRFYLLKSDNYNEEFINERKKYIDELVSECFILKRRD